VSNKTKTIDWITWIIEKAKINGTTDEKEYADRCMELTIYGSKHRFIQ